MRNENINKNIIEEIETLLKKELNENEKVVVYRKLFEDMSKLERIYLIKRKELALNKGVNFAKHALERMNERFIKENEVLNAIRNGQIIEYKKIGESEILVIRGCHVNNQNKQVYVVFSITHRKVITTYFNKHWVILKKKRKKKTNDYKIDIKEPFRSKLFFYYNIPKKDV